MAATFPTPFPSAAINFITFNQDHSCIAVGTSKGYRIFNTDPFNRVFSTEEVIPEQERHVSIIEMLFSTSLVALVLNPRHLVIQNTKRSSVICELTFPTSILAVRLNRRRLAVVLADVIYIYDVQNMALLFTINTSPNPNAICALSPSSENCYLALPVPKPREDPSERRPAHAPPLSTYVPSTTGEIIIYDTLSGKVVSICGAHSSPLSCIAMNNDGTMMATASEKGTVIRVFSVPAGKKLHQFRRGVHQSTIYSMSFNLSSTLLCVSSTSDTVHIFRLSPARSADQAAGQITHERAEILREGGAAGDEPAGDDATPPESSALPQRGRGSSARSQGKDSGNASPASDDATEIVGRSKDTVKNGAPECPQSGSFSSMLRRSSQLMGRSVVGAMGAYLPQAVTGMLEPERHFAYIKISKHSAHATDTRDLPGHPNSRVRVPYPSGSGIVANSGARPLRSVVAMSSNSPQVMVVTSNGDFYVFNIDMENGGEGYLVQQFSIADGDETLDGSMPA
ncbi:unnamed protein product [Discula destructiva]